MNYKTKRERKEVKCAIKIDKGDDKMVNVDSFQCDCDDFEKNWTCVRDFIANNVNKYNGGITRKNFSGIIGSAISHAEGGMHKNGVLKSKYKNAHDYAIAIMNAALNSHYDKTQNTAAGRFSVMISDPIVECYIYCWIIRNFNS